jgi:hypothetical protein
MQTPRLPKKICDDPAAAGLEFELVARAEPLWADGQQGAARAELTTRLGEALKSAFSAGRIVRGLESAERALASEQRGLQHVDRTTGVERGGRISRLLVLADDGSLGFYRSVGYLLRRHAPRVLALRLEVAEGALGELLFGAEEVARLVLVEHKDAVSAILLALAEDWND